MSVYSNDGSICSIRDMCLPRIVHYLNSFSDVYSGRRILKIQRESGCFCGKGRAFSGITYAYYYRHCSVAAAATATVSG